MNSDVRVEDNADCSMETEFNDVLTGTSCTILIAELIKYILYQKQQLPYTFDRLKYVVSKSKSEGTQKSANVERLFKAARDGLATLEMLFEKTEMELSDLNKGRVTEIAVMFGVSPLTPKQVYRIHLPDVHLGHLPVNHPERRSLMHLLKCILESSKLTDMLSKPMGPTNMFVLIKKQNVSDKISTWFLPKNRYKMPTSGQHFHIKFRHPNLETLSCTCHGFSIYSDDCESPDKLNKSADKTEYQDFGSGDPEDTETEWYQACATFRGFKDVFINGVSASDLWLRK